jgi:hypothetical protein
LQYRCVNIASRTAYLRNVYMSYEKLDKSLDMFKNCRSISVKIFFVGFSSGKIFQQNLLLVAVW